MKEGGFMASKRPEFIIPDFMLGTSPQEIHERMMNDLPKDIDNMPGGFPYDMTMPTAVLASELVNFHLMRAIMVAFPQYSWGDWLDLHGKESWLERHEATYASGELMVTGKPGTEIQSNRFFSTAATSEVAAVEFRSTKTVIIGESGTANVPVQAVLPGKISNVGADTVILQNKPIDGVSVTNPAPITGGTEREIDDDYYARLQLENKSEGMSFIANNNDYIRWALSVDAVKECIVMQAWNGPGTVKLVLIDSNGDPANEDICNDVFEYIVSPNDRSKRILPAGSAELTVVGGTIVPVSYTCTGLLYDKELTNLEQIQRDFKSAVEDVYRKSKDLGKFVYHQAESIIADIQGVIDYEVFLVNDSENDIMLSEEEYPKTSSMAFS